MDEKEEEPFRGWSQPQCVQWARHILFLHTQLRPQHPALAVHLTSAELGDREGSVALLLPSHKGTGEWGADQNDGVSSPFALTTCIELQPDTISHFQKQKAP